MDNRSFIENVSGQTVVVVNTLNGSINMTLASQAALGARVHERFRRS